MAAKKFKTFTVEKYLNALASREPIPGGGSASALAGALGASLLSMVTHYSLHKGKPAAIEDRLQKCLVQSEKLRQTFLKLVDRDAEVYLNIVKAKNAPQKIKDKAYREANQVSVEICRLCSQAMDLTPFLVKYGNQRLISDIEAAIEFLLASFNSSMAMISANS
jgi:methenyltetrahydrofolate cyclohydrolase